MAARRRAGWARGAGVPEDVATLPSFRAPASRRLLLRSGGESGRRGLPAEGDLPLTPCPKAEPGPLPPRCRPGCGGGGGVKAGDRGADRSQGPETSGATTPTRRAGHPGPGASTRPAAGFLFPEAEGGGGGRTAASSPGPCRVGPGAGERTGCRRIGVQVSVSGGLCERAPPDGSPVYMSARAGFPSSWYFCCRVLGARE